MKLVSVIIPFYNEEEYIEKALISVLNQTYENLEILLINDGSTDNSLKIVKKFNDKRIKIIESTNNGVSIARNIGIKESKGNYLCFLDADDYWEKNKIEKQVKFIEKNNYSFIYSNYRFIKRNGKFGNIVNVPKSLNYKQALKNTTIFISTVMLNTEKIEKKYIYMPDKKRGQDTATWWNILKNDITAYGINDVLAYYRIKPKSLSSNKLLAIKATWEIYKLQNIKFISRIYYFICYIINAIKRRI